MRFLSLSLLKYGPFTDLVLDLSTPDRGLHLLYGPNEAGKSTTLRAITGFLYGIPMHTPDAHLHRMPDLRIGARLEGAGGAVLDVVRRKGKGTSNTLADRADNVVDERTLQRMLGGVGQELFGVMFGITHEALRRGGEALLAGKGDLGESLFGAGLGQSGLHQIREDLEREAEELFTQKARIRPLNDALRAFSEAQKRARDLSLSSEGWLKQKEAIEQATAEKLRLSEEVKRAQTQQHRMRRAKRALPLIAKRKQLVARALALTGVVRLPDRASQEREDALRTAAEAKAREGRLSGQIRELEARRAALVVPRSLLSEGDAVEDIQGRLGAFRKAQADLPRLRAEQSQLHADARAILARLGSDEALDRVEAKRVDAATQARIRQLALKPAALEEKLWGIQRAAADIELRIDRQRARLGALPPPKELSALRRAVGRAQAQGDLEQRLRKAEGEQRRLEQSAAGKLAALGLWTGPLASVVTIPLPPMESIERAEREQARLERERELRGRELGQLEQRRGEVERAIDEIGRAGAVPTEAELAAARASRDELWERVRRELVRAQDGARKEQSGEDGRSLADTFQERARRADEVSDRLRREAERVAKLAGHLAAREADARQAEARRVELASIEQKQTAAMEAWRALFRPAGIEPLSPGEMRGWLARHSSLAAQIEQMNAAAMERDALARQLDEHRSEIEAALETHGEPPSHRASDAGTPNPTSRRAREDLGALIERGARAVNGEIAAAREREELGASIEALLKEQDRLKQQTHASEDELATWREAWAKSVRGLGLEERATPERVIATLDELNELFQKVDEIKKTQRRVDALEQDASQFEVDVEALTTAHAEDLRSSPADHAAAQLLKRYQQGAADKAERDQIDRELRSLRTELDEQHRRGQAANEKLAELIRAASARDLLELEAAERRSREAQDLEREIAAIEDHLLTTGEGATIDGLVDEVSGLDADRLAVDLAEIDARLATLEDQRANQERRLGGLQADLDRLSGASAAAEAAAEAQESLARIRALSDRYLRTRLGAILLAREIERYRDRHQGPILSRASELFQRLTLGAYSGLRAGYDEKDQPILRCLRADNREAEITGLSDGTRDQLFLSLRLASLERHAASNEPMPVIVDDILIHFDDDRARAALSAFGELAQRTQVLFFTHHGRLLELAREVIAPERLREHRLA